MPKNGGGKGTGTIVVTSQENRKILLGPTHVAEGFYSD